MSLYSSDQLFSAYQKVLTESQLSEVLDSENEQGKGDIPQKETDSISALGTHSQQRVKRVVYEINNRAKVQGISIERAYYDFMKTATFGGLERNAIKSKLGVGVGGTAVKEEKITEVTGFGKVDPKTGKYDTTTTSSSQKKYREGLPTRSSHVRDSSQALTNVPAKQAYDGGVGSPDMAMTPDKRAKLAAKRAERQGDGKRANKIRTTMTRNEHREWVLNRAINKESFGWRSELSEFVGNTKKKSKKDEQIQEMPADHSNKIIVNPKLNERKDDPCWDGYSAAGMKKKNGKTVPNCVPEEAVLDAVAEYFYNEGLNENGVEILIEDLGVDEFCEFVDEIINEQLLFESNKARRAETRGKLGTLGSGMTKSGKSFKDVKGGARTTSRRAARKALGRDEGPRKQALNRPGNSDMKSSLSKQSQIANAKSTQKPTNSTPTKTKEKTKGGIINALKDRAARDTELLKKSWKTARDVGKKHEKTAARVAGTVAGAAVGAAKVARTAGEKFGNSETGQKTKEVLAKTTNAAAGAAGAGLGAKKSGKSVAGSAGRAIGTFVRKMREDSEILDELKMPKDKRGKLPGLDFVTKVKTGLRNLAHKEPKSKVPYAALRASNEIDGDLIEQGGDDRQRMGQVSQLKRQHDTRKKRLEQEAQHQERLRVQDEHRYIKKIKSLGGDISDVNEIYHLTPPPKKMKSTQPQKMKSDKDRYGVDPEKLVDDIKARNRSRLNSSYSVDLEMTEESPDIKKMAMGSVLRLGEDSRLKKYALQDLERKMEAERAKNIPNVSKFGRAGVRLPNSPNKIDFPDGYRVTTKPPKMNVTHIKSGEKK